MAKFPKKLRKRIEERISKNAFRNLASPKKLVDFSSNDYLGFSGSKVLFDRSASLLIERGIAQNGATGARLLSGNHELYDELELKIMAFHRAESALVFNSGYDANSGFFGSVPQRGDVVFYDEYAHASIRDGLRLCHAKSYKFKHNDLDDLKVKCHAERNRSTNETEIYIVTESVFSMDGDSPDLKTLADFSKTTSCHLVVDEAHAIGVFGTKGVGLVQQLGLEDIVFARIVTFGKALGCHGAAILGSSQLKEYLVNFARSFIYTTALPPHTLASVYSAYDLMGISSGEEQIQLLHENISFFKKTLNICKLEDHFINSDSAIQSCLVPGNGAVKRISNKLAENGFSAKAILAPTVPEGEERLRFCLHSFNTKEEIGFVLRLLKKELS